MSNPSGQSPSEGALRSAAPDAREFARPENVDGSDAPRARTSLRSIVSATVLKERPSRAPDFVAENQALIALAHSLANAPEGILQKLADTALSICHAHSAGLSLLEDGDRRKNFHWRAIAGEFASRLNGGTPRDFGPCGTVLDRNSAQLCSHPEVDFPYFSESKPPLEEILLVPFYIEGQAVGTIWVVSHNIATRRFDAEDLRVMTNLAAFTGAAYQTYLATIASRRFAAIVEDSDDGMPGSLNIFARISPRPAANEIRQLLRISGWAPYLLILRD
jgi:hypothetical protein